MENGVGIDGFANYLLVESFTIIFDKISKSCFGSKNIFGIRKAMVNFKLLCTCCMIEISKTFG